MQEAIRRYTEDLRRSHGIEVQIRVGLNSGEVVVRSVGSDLRMDYSAVGQTTHLAARMEQLAPPGTIRLTAETLRLADGFVQVHGLGPRIANISALRPPSPPRGPRPRDITSRTRTPASRGANATAIAVGVSLLGFGMLVGMALDRMRFDVQRTAVLTGYEQALREWKTYRMAFEKDAALIRQEPRTTASRP
jgi:hypothetical protein